MAEYLPMFKSPEGEKEYLKAYDYTLSLWEVAYESYTIPTAYGDTHVISSGPQDGLPLILLHASGGSSTMWAPNIADLSKNYRIHAVDVLGEVGKSKATKPMLERQECNRWLVDVLDGLGIKNCFIAGQSKGAWLALNLALSHPDRVEKLILLGPAYSFQAMNQKFYRKFAWLMLRPNRSVATEFLQWMSTEDINRSAVSKAITEQMYLGIKHLKMHKTLVPDVFTDDELTNLQAKTLLLVGQKEVLHDTKLIVDRTNKLVPQIKTEIIPDAGHTVAMDQPKLVNHKILHFLAT